MFGTPATAGTLIGSFAFGRSTSILSPFGLTSNARCSSGMKKAVLVEEESGFGSKSCEISTLLRFFARFESEVLIASYEAGQPPSGGVSSVVGSSARGAAPPAIWRGGGG